MKKITKEEALSFVSMLKELYNSSNSVISANKLEGWGNQNHVRRVVHKAREMGYPICSNSHGIFYSEEPEDIESTMKRLLDKVSSIREIIDVLSKQHRKFSRKEEI
jgi:hypothetical protein